MQVHLGTCKITDAFGAKTKADRAGENLLEGIRFRYTPVAAAEVWDEARGYGYNVPDMSDESRHRVRSKLDGDRNASEDTSREGCFQAGVRESRLFL